MKPLSKMLLLAPMLVGILLLSTDVVIAQVWTGVGSAFVPDEGSAPSYEATDGQFRHKGDKTGTIVGRCNVTNPVDYGGNPMWNTLEVVYKAPPGSFCKKPPLCFDKYMVTVNLMEVSNSTGIGTLVKTFSSVGFDKGNAFQLQRALFSHFFNFYDYAYFVQLSIYRKDAQASPAVAIVRLVYNIP